MKRFLPVLKVLVLLAAIVCVFVAADALAKGGGPLGCPRDINCPDVYDPVWCDQGMFPNACYAFAACATGCGGGGS